MNKSSKILVTGSSGFVGESLCHHLLSKDYLVVGSVRTKSNKAVVSETIVVDSLGATTDWKFALVDCETVIHLAGRAHILTEKAANPLEAFRLINTVATLNLAEQAAKCGVARFIFLSSIGVNGAYTTGVPFRSDDVTSPHSPYAVSKYEAEIGLKLISKREKMEVVIIRAPAIYGVNAPGNFGLIEKFIRNGIPLPLGSIKNKRSLVSMENLVSLISVCIKHEKAGNRVLLVSDDNDLSTPEIVRLLSKLVNKEAKLVNIPIKFLKIIFWVLGRAKSGESLMGDLVLDSKPTQDLLGWSPPFNPRL